MDEKKGKKLLKKRRNIMSQYFYNISQKILNDRLLLAITSKKKKKIKWQVQIKTNNNLPPKIYCENIMNITLFKK